MMYFGPNRIFDLVCVRASLFQSRNPWGSLQSQENGALGLDPLPIGVTRRAEFKNGHESVSRRLFKTKSPGRVPPPRTHPKTTNQTHPPHSNSYTHVQKHTQTPPNTNSDAQNKRKNTKETQKQHQNIIKTLQKHVLIHFAHFGKNHFSNIFVGFSDVWSSTSSNGRTYVRTDGWTDGHIFVPKKQVRNI